MRDLPLGLTAGERYSTPAVGLNAPVEPRGTADLFHVTRVPDSRDIVRQGLRKQESSPAEKKANEFTDGDDLPPMVEEPNDVMADRRFDEVVRNAKYRLELEDTFPDHDEAVFFWPDLSRAKRAYIGMKGQPRRIVHIDSSRMPDDCVFATGPSRELSTIWDGIYGQFSDFQSGMDQDEAFDRALDWWRSAEIVTPGRDDIPRGNEVWTNCNVPPEAIVKITDPEREDDPDSTILQPPREGERTIREFAAPDGPEFGDVQTPRELFDGPHSYRSHDAAEYHRTGVFIRDELTGERGEEERKKLKDALSRIEGRRWGPMLEAASEFFFKLDADEMELFTRRNPDLMQWISAWHLATGRNPYQQYYDMAAEALGPDRERAQDPPLFDRADDLRTTRGDPVEMLEQARTRRRSYRGWSPQVIRELYEAGREGELEDGTVPSWNPEEEKMEKVPVRPSLADWAAREKVYDRIEGGRLMAFADEVINVYARLDMDEQRLFAARNPGMVMWASAFGRVSGLIHGEQLNVGFPTLGEVGRDPLDGV